MPGKNLIPALKWSMASEIASKAIQPFVFIVLARLLTPEDFGVMAAALMVISFSQIFWEAGMGKALIQRQTDVEEAANVAFWVNIGLSCIIAAILFLVAGPVADTFFQDARVTAVLQVMTLQVFLGAVASVHTALLQKRMGFRHLFWVRFATVSLPGFASIPLALNGMGYWALVAGTLLGQVAQAIMLWRLSPFRPNFVFKKIVANEMVSFGAWVGASGLLTWFYIWADSLIVGVYLGSHELGLYRTGNQFVAMIFALVFSPLIPVLYSFFSKMDGDKERIRSAMERVIKVLIVIGLPIAFTLFSLSEPIGVYVFGAKWSGIGMIIGAMALIHGYSWIVGMNGEVYRALGKPALETIVTASILIIYLVAYLVSIQYGFEEFVWTRLGLAIGALILHLVFLKRILFLSLGPLAKFIISVSLVSIAITQVSLFILKGLYLADWQMILIGGFMNASLLAVTLFFLERKGVVLELERIYKSRKT